MGNASGNIGTLSAFSANWPSNAARGIAPSSVCIGEGSVVVVDFGDGEVVAVKLASGSTEVDTVDWNGFHLVPEVLDLEKPLAKALVAQMPVPGQVVTFKQANSDWTGEEFPVSVVCLGVL